MSDFVPSHTPTPAAGVPAAVKVLIVDDEELTRLLLSHMLQRVKVEHMEVFSAEDGEQALRIAQEQRPDVILLDLLLPKMDGNEVCRRLREVAGYQPHIIMLTARGQLDDRERARALGVSQFMTKPFSPSQLIADLNALWAGPR